MPSISAPGPRKDLQMRRHVRSIRRLHAIAAVVGLAATVALILPAPVPAATRDAGAVRANHACLVMTGSGDPAFVKNFNPYTATGQPSGQFVRGAFYEPLIISTVAGGGHTYPWLAQSWKWSGGNKTLTLNLVRNAKWTDGKPLTSADVVYSLTAGNQNKTMDMVGLASPDTNIASVKPSGPYKVVIRLKTIDSQFIAANLNAQFVVPKHIWSKVADPTTFTN